MSSSSAPVLRERWSPNGSSRPACPCCAWSRVTGRIEPTTREPPPNGSSAPPSNGRASRASATVRPTTPSISARPEPRRAQFQRCRRRERALQRAMAPHAAGRLSRSQRGRRRGEMAAHLRGPAALLRGDRLTTSEFPAWAATRCTPARCRSTPCRRSRSAPSDSGYLSAHARLGWHWWPGTNTILSAPHHGRNPCVQRGSCGSGCNGRRRGVHRCHPLAERGAQWWTSRHGSAGPTHRRRRSWTCVRRGEGGPRRTRAVRSRRCHRVREQRYRTAEAPVGVRHVQHPEGLANAPAWSDATSCCIPSCGSSGCSTSPSMPGTRTPERSSTVSSSATVMPVRGFVHAARPGRWERPADRLRAALAPDGPRH